MKVEYPVQILWSPEDQAYIAIALQLPGCLADGSTPEEAIANLRDVIATWIEVAKEEGRHIPNPVTAEDVEREEAKQAQQLQQHINSAVASAVQKVLEQLASATAEPTGTGYYNFLRAGFSRHRDPEPAGSGRR